MRQQILTHARGANGMRASAEEFVPPVGALSGVVNPVIGGLGLGSREEAEERISRQLEENANRPLWTGENVSFSDLCYYQVKARTSDRWR